jgi:ubiquinone/menaquinone biosynthesis C-methylase UbiE
MAKEASGPRSRSPSFFERARLRRRAPLLAALQQALQVNPSTRLLDLGGGSGALTEVLGRGAGEVVVVDPSRRKIMAGRKRRPNVTFVETEAESLPFDAQHFDRVVSTMAYHHFHDPDRVMGEVARVLETGGRVVLSDIDPTTTLGRRLRWFEHSLLRRAHHFDTRDMVSACLRAHGLRISHEGALGPFYIVTAEEMDH